MAAKHWNICSRLESSGTQSCKNSPLQCFLLLCTAAQLPYRWIQGTLGVTGANIGSQGTVNDVLAEILALLLLFSRSVLK